MASDDKILQPGEAAKMMGVDPKTLNRWASKGLIPHFRTLGGHRRYRTSDIRKALESQGR